MTIEGINIYGSPWQPWYHDWAFNLERGEEIKKKWDLIPQGVDVLITHGPPHKILDKTIEGVDAGCEMLVEAIKRVKPKIHVFGHIHEARGQVLQDGVHYINACSCDLTYRAKFSPIVVDYEVPTI